MTVRVFRLRVDFVDADTPWVTASDAGGQPLRRRSPPVGFTGLASQWRIPGCVLSVSLSLETRDVFRYLFGSFDIKMILFSSEVAAESAKVLKAGDLSGIFNKLALVQRFKNRKIDRPEASG